MTPLRITGPVLLTGAGGDIGIALARVLREALPHITLIGADCDPRAPGAAFVDRFTVLPQAQSPGYMAQLEALVAQHDAQIVIPLAEAELGRLLDQDRIGGHLSGAALITANRAALQTGLDKHLTARTLDAVRVPVPETGIVGEDEPGGFDLIIKPRSGQGSKGLVRLKRTDFDQACVGRQGDLWQRWLKEDAAEFTCGLARFPGMPTRSIHFRRQLRGGLTGSGEVVNDPALDALCVKVAEAINLEGAVNVQLRMDAGRPCVFEINPRFSSTVGFRHRLGFQDAIWAIEHRLGLPLGRYDAPPAGTRIDRVASELIRPPELDPAE